MDVKRPIVVVGSGYVGLVAALSFAEMGHRVICVDKDAAKIAVLQSGRPTIHERYLPSLMLRHGNKAVTFTTRMAEAVSDAEIIFLAVGTPLGYGGKANLSHLEAAIIEIAQSLQHHAVLVEKSTVPVCTSRWIGEVMERNGVPRAKFDVVSNPEFLREGTAVTDFLHPDRLVLGYTLGSRSDQVAELAEAIYRPLTSGEYYRRAESIPGPCDPDHPPPMLRTSIESAELIKHGCNAFLAMKVSFINGIANMCEAVGANITEVAQGIGSDPRIGGKFLRPGIGYGGSCFPKDLAALRAVAEEVGVDFSLLAAVETLNELQPVRFLDRARAALGGFAAKQLGVLGLAYKGGTDDVRESPALRIVEWMLDEGASIAAYDPAAMERAQAVLPSRSNLHYTGSAEDAAKAADALIILTDWPEFASLDLTQIRNRLRSPLIIDGRNLYDPATLATQGFTYVSIGRQRVGPEDAARVSAVGNETSKPKPVASQEPANVEDRRSESSKSGMRILLTGAAGFLGSHLADRLLADGHVVVGVDNLDTGHLQNLAHLRREPRFELIERDICEIFDPGPVDFILNFASPASPPQYMRLGIETLRAGSQGTRNMLELARKYGARFLHASTSECYGTPQVHPQPESYWGNVNPVGPRSVYDESKRFAEALVMAYRRNYEINTRLARIFNTYGPRMQPDDGRVISNFIMQALRGEDVTVYGDGLQTRSFCYVTDLIEGIVRLCGVHEGLPVNLGNPSEETVLGCAQRVIALVGAPSCIRFEPLPPDDPPRRQPDIQKARQLLGWEPVVTLDDGLTRTIAYFRALRNDLALAYSTEVDAER